MTVEITEDGSATLRSAVYGDTYHSLRGAMGEARHVFVEAGFREVCRAKKLPPPTRDARVLLPAGEESSHTENSRRMAVEDRRGGGIRILEMGFGTGLNAWLTLPEAERSGQRVEYTAVELYPVPEEVAARLGYTDDARFMALHSAPWGEWTEISEGFRLLKLNSDLADTEFSDKFDLVYWDAFAPDTQPGLWTGAVFGRIFAAMFPGGVLVTYSAKGDVRRALQDAGFTIEKLPGALGKRHMLRASRQGTNHIFYEKGIQI